MPWKLVGFIRAMEGAGLTGDEWWYMLDKPWKWHREYTEWIEAGEPVTEDDPGWDEFFDRVEKVQA